MSDKYPDFYVEMLMHDTKSFIDAVKHGINKKALAMVFEVEADLMLLEKLSEIDKEEQGDE